MAEFIRVSSVSDMPDSGRLTLEVEDRLVVLLLVDGNFFCVDDVCTHDGGPLGDGTLEGHCLACPRHGAQFDIRTGRAMTMPATEATGHHEVQIDGDDVLVRIVED